jgi:hypothetical protein
MRGHRDFDLRMDRDFDERGPFQGGGNPNYHGNNPHHMSGLPPPQIKVPVPCTFFASPAGCRFGDGCRNIHDMGDSRGDMRKPRPESSHRPEFDNPENTDEIKKVEMGKRICYEFKNKGRLDLRGTCVRL